MITEIIEQRKYLIIICLTGALIFVLLLIYLNTRSDSENPSQEINSEEAPQLTSLPTVPPEEIVSEYTDAPVLTPEPFTGVTEPEFTEEEASIIDAKIGLRKRTPYQGDGFLINFDYTQDVFTVTFNPDNDTTRQTFERWVQTNYPRVSLDEFIYTQ